MYEQLVDENKEKSLCFNIYPFKIFIDFFFKASGFDGSLIESCSKGNLEEVKKLIAKGMDVNQHDYDNRTPLHLAASEGHLELVKFLLSKGANIDSIDRFGNSPLADALRQGKKLVAQHLESLGAVRELGPALLRQTREFASAIDQALPLIAQRGDWEYVEAWVPEDNGTKWFSEQWYSDTNNQSSFSEYRKETQGLSSPTELISRVAKSLKPLWIPNITKADFGERYQAAHSVGVQSSLVLPIIRNEELLAIFVFLGKSLRQKIDDSMLAYTSSLASGMLASSLFSSGRATASSLFAYAGLSAGQMAIIYQNIVAEGVFAPVIVFQEVDWFYRMGLPVHYWETFSPSQIARHVHSFIAAKKLARTTDDPENISFTLESSDKTSGFYLCNDDHDMVEKIEQKVMHNIEATHLETPYSFISYISDGPMIPGGTKKLNITLFDTQKYVSDVQNPDEKDLNKVATTAFLNKPQAVRDRYQELINVNVGKISPTFMTFPEYRDGTIPIMMAFKRSNTSYLGLINESIQGNKLVCKRKFVETFSNGIVVYSLYFVPTTNLIIQQFLNQVSLIVALPSSALTPLFTNGNITADEYAYASSTLIYTYYFTNEQDEEIEMLSKTLANDPLNLHRLKSIQKKMKREVVSRRKIIDCLSSDLSLLKDTFEHFAAVSQGKVPPHSTTEIKSKIDKNMITEIDNLIWNSLLTFNNSVLKTNFFSPKKACLSFRLSPNFLQGQVPVVPYGVFMLVGNEFHGFHIRFEDIARGGVRMIRSSSDLVYSANFETVFQENYNLAFTQTLKNKEIPESGSKGTVLLNRANQNNAKLAFQKWVSGVLDLMVPKAGVHDMYGKEELIFLGPDEGTADYMYWAAEYAHRRGYKYWKAFTTGKPPSIGGIPHDTYAMTTRSVHAYVLACLKKAGLEETKVTKFQTGGPDGDLGSNEIFISKDATTAIVDGSGVIYDPKGLDRQELTRLAKARLMVKDFNRNKLNKGGFVVLLSDQDITLPNGEFVESGTKFRNEFHLHPLASADVFVPCGGRPESINLSNVERLIDDKGTPRFKFIVEGANLFLTNDARMILEKAGVVIYKDASTNKGGVTSSSYEVIAALAMSEAEHIKLMCANEKGELSEFYNNYVKEIQYNIEKNAEMEFECTWNEHELTGKPRFMLTEEISMKINTINLQIKKSNLYDKPQLRHKILSEALPKTLTKVVPIETIMQRVPEAYMKAIFGSYLASHFVYKYGISSHEFAFFDFMQEYMA